MVPIDEVWKNWANTYRPLTTATNINIGENRFPEVIQRTIPTEPGALYSTMKIEEWGLPL